MVAMMNRITMILVGVSLLSISFYANADDKNGPLKNKFKVRCESVVLLGANLAMIPPIGPATGPAHFVVAGEPLLAAATTELLGPPVPQIDGTQAIIVKLSYDFGGNDVLFAFATGVLTATERENVFANTAKINYAGGTGKYVNAFGRFDGVGDLNFADLEVNMTGSGQVCNLAKD